MRLAEIKTRPTRAGKAKLEFEGIEKPKRDKDLIILPNYANAELFKLKPNYEQFLFAMGVDLWFGGTDENPFLVRMNNPVINDFYTGGPKKFYNEIMPKLTNISGRLRRQGDIFATPTYYSFDEIIKAHKICLDVEISIKEIKDMPVLNTRHLFSGQILTTQSMRGLSNRMVIEGTIKAPDHEDMILKQPHIFSQTVGLYEPPKAD